MGASYNEQVRMIGTPLRKQASIFGIAQASLKFIVLLAQPSEWLTCVCHTLHSARTCTFQQESRLVLMQVPRKPHVGGLVCPS